MKEKTFNKSTKKMPSKQKDQDQETFFSNSFAILV